MDAWHNPWLRALLHPALLVGTALAVCFAFATRPEPNETAVFLFLYLMPVVGALGLVPTALMVSRLPVSPERRAAIVLAGGLGCFAATILGWIGWLHAAEIVCGDRYECPL